MPSDMEFVQAGAEPVEPPSKKPELILPCDSHTIDESGAVAYTHFKENQLFFRQGRTVKRVNGDWLETISAETFRSILGRHFNCLPSCKVRGGHTWSRNCVPPTKQEDF